MFITTRPPVGLAGAVPLSAGSEGPDGTGLAVLGRRRERRRGLRLLRLSGPFLRRRQVRPSGCAGGSGAGHHGLGALGPLRADLPARQLRLRWVMAGWPTVLGGRWRAPHPILCPLGLEPWGLGNPGDACLGDLSVRGGGCCSGIAAFLGWEDGPTLQGASFQEHSRQARLCSSPKRAKSCSSSPRARMYRGAMALDGVLKPWHLSGPVAAAK